MKSGLVVSSGIHLAVLTWGLWAFSSPPPLDVSYSEALPVEIVMAESFQGVKGEKDAKISEKPAPKPTTKPAKLPMPAENVGENETDLDTPPTPEKTRNQTPQTGAPKPSARPEAEPVPAKETPKVAEAKPPEPKPPEPKPPEPKPSEPKPPEPKPEPVKEKPKPTPPKETVEKIDPLAEMIAEDKTEPVPEPVKEPVPKKLPTPAVKPKPAEPVKVAEAKPETSKAESKKPAPKKDKPVKEDKADEDAPDSAMDFEAMAAAAINKQKAAGGGAKRSTEMASLGSKKTTGAKLSASETDALREQLSGCWSIPAGLEEGAGLRTSVQFSLNSGGKLEGRPVVSKSSGNRVFDESAVRAIQKCDRDGFTLPPDKAEDWAEVTVNFDPSEMF